MARSTENPDPLLGIKREAQALVKFVPWLLLSLLFVLMAWRADSAAWSGLFQSSPVRTATALPPAPDTPTPIPSPSTTSTPLPDTTPVVTATAVRTPTITVTLTPTPTLTLTPTPTVTPTLTPTETVTPSTPVSGETDEGRQRYLEDPSNVSFDWGMLLDSVALALSYVWLGCGILVFVTIPVGFAVLWVVSRRRHSPLE